MLYWSMKLWFFFLCIRFSSQDDQMQPWTITFINCPCNLLQNVGKVVWCLHYFLHHHQLQNMEKMVWCALACIACLKTFVMHQHPLKKNGRKKMFDAHLLASQSLTKNVRGAAHVETNLEPNSGNTAPPFWSERYLKQIEIFSHREQEKVSI